MKENTGPGSTIKDTKELYEPGGRGEGTGGGRFEYKKLFQRDQELKIIDDMIGVVPGVASREQCEHIVGLVSKYYFQNHLHLHVHYHHILHQLIHECVV